MLWRERELPEDCRWLVDLCQNGDVCLDVGANIGYTSLAAARAVGQQGRVVALEPAERAYDLLSQNAQRSPWAPIHTLRLACGEKAGTAHLYVARNSQDRSSLAPQRLLGRIGVEAVEMCVLRDVCRDLCITPDLVKIDTEGAEWPVLRGLLPDISPRSMLVEVCAQNTQPFGYRPSAMCQWIASHGYDLRVIRAVDNTEIPYADETVDKFEIGNLIATRTA